MITNKVLDSVKQIESRVNVLFEDSKDLHEVDISIARESLKSSIESLLEVYNEHPERTSTIQTLKSVVDGKALLLERLIYRRTGKYEDLIKLRTFAETFYNDVISRVKEFTEMETTKSEHLVTWATYVPFAMKLSLCAKQTCFEIDDEDGTMIEKITRELTLVNKLREV